MKMIRILLILCVLQFLLFVNVGNTALNVSPTTTTIGNQVTIALTGSFSGGGTFILHLDFGDGSPAVSSPVYSKAGNYSLNATHSYSQAGGYTVTGTTTRTSLVSGGTSTTIETQGVTIQQDSGKRKGGTLAKHPRGIVGENYQYNLVASPADRSNRCRLTRGKLPPGLELESNCDVIGIPVQRGSFAFTVQVSNPRNATYAQEHTLQVDPGQLIIEVSPKVINATWGGAASEEVTFTVIHPTVSINETIRSNRGEFMVNGRVVGSINSALSINLNSPHPSSSETVKIPNNVLDSAQSAGTSKIIYRRIFSSQNLKPGSGDTRVKMRTPASGGLRFTRLRVFFEQNNRPIILVQRNERDLTGVIEIHYNGSGTLKGYWHVDGRIIERVQKNVFYGKVLTLKTPKAPPLPTYSEGAHRLQFVITEPEAAQQRIAYPEAIYHVEAKTAGMVVAIMPTAPKNDAELSLYGADFAWTELPRIARYHIDYFEKGKEEPFFTAYTKHGLYHLPEKVIELKFATGKIYTWKVKGFSSLDELSGESMEYQFSLIEE